ncbi:MAG: hypothetical protein K2Z81_17600, partial [Cyanobacteria bacterium]|nr:hypothetical protein [Cyanobacteriota bacterium]
ELRRRKIVFKALARQELISGVSDVDISRLPSRAHRTRLRRTEMGESFYKVAMMGIVLTVLLILFIVVLVLRSMH